jgi:hypothetical protein
MWATFSVAFEAALLFVVGCVLLVRAKAPNKANLKELVVLNVACVLAASVFALFLDTHGRAPVSAYVIAALQPFALAAFLATRRGQQRIG